MSLSMLDNTAAGRPNRLKDQDANLFADTLPSSWATDNPSRIRLLKGCRLLAGVDQGGRATFTLTLANANLVREHQCYVRGRVLLPFLKTFIL